MIGSNLTDIDDPSQIHELRYDISRQERADPRTVCNHEDEIASNEIRFIFILPMSLKTGRDLLHGDDRDPNKEIEQRLFISRSLTDHPGQLVVCSDSGRRRLLKPVAPDLQTTDASVCNLFLRTCSNVQG